MYELFTNFSIFAKYVRKHISSDKIDIALRKRHVHMVATHLYTPITDSIALLLSSLSLSIVKSLPDQCFLSSLTLPFSGFMVFLTLFACMSACSLSQCTVCFSCSKNQHTIAVTAVSDQDNRRQCLIQTASVLSLPAAVHMLSQKSSLSNHTKKV